MTGPNFYVSSLNLGWKNPCLSFSEKKSTLKVGENNDSALPSYAHMTVHTAYKLWIGIGNDFPTKFPIQS